MCFVLFFFPSLCTTGSARLGSAAAAARVTFRYLTGECLLVCRISLTCIMCARESTFGEETVGIYVESLPCAHAVSLIVR